MIEKYIIGLRNEFVKDNIYIEDETFVISKFSRIFSLENLPNLSKNQFKNFLLYRNNKHWSGIFRQGNMITNDMVRLRRTLEFLQNEKIPIEERLNEIISKKGKYYIKGLGRAVLTPILLVLFPEKYCVFNNINEKAMKMLEIYPNFSRGTTFAEKYNEINRIVNSLASKFNLSLWQMDTLWWFSLKHSESIDDLEIDSLNEPIQFQLEKHLEYFIIENWEKINFFKDYEIFIDENNDQGLQYITDIGKIDILCVNKNTNDIVIIELKKDRGSDDAVGQILRYIGWVEEHLANHKQNVKGIILSRKRDEKLKYAVQATDKISYHSYEIKFKIV